MSYSDLLVYALIVAVVVLFNLAMRLIANRSKRQESETSGTASQPLPEELLEHGWGRMGTAVPAPTEPQAMSSNVSSGASADSAGATSRVHPALRRLLADPRELRHAIVLLTVLGPCRANESPDSRDR